MKQTELLWAGALLATCVLSGCRSETLSPSAPTSRPGMRNIPELPSMPASIVDAPISYALEPALTALEQAVPRRFGDFDKRLQIPGNKRQQVAFAATRTPFLVKFDGEKQRFDARIARLQVPVSARHSNARPAMRGAQRATWTRRMHCGLHTTA